MIFGPKPAYQDENRPWPTFQCVRPAASFIGGGGAIGANYCVIKQDSPTTAFYNPSNIEARSTANDAYEDASQSMKTIVMFNTVLSQNSVYFVILSNGVTTGFAGQNSHDLSVIPSAPSVIDHTDIRCRAISSSYDISALTWNDFIATPPSYNGGGDINFYSTILSTLTGGVTYSFFNEVGGLQLFASVPIYGIVIDCKTKISVAPTSISSYLKLGPRSGSFSSRIYAVPIS